MKISRSKKFRPDPAWGDAEPEIAATFHFSRPAGRIAYSLPGQGPLVICIPGMGDVRSAYASLASVGSLDPDFADLRAEARWIAGQLQGKMLMVPEAGHYPQAEFPELVSPAIVAFAQDLKPTVN